MTIDLNDGKLAVSQERFLSNGEVDASGTQWWVPISLGGPGGVSRGSIDLKVESSSSALEGGEGGWVKANVGQTGFYRVRYDFLTTFINAVQINSLGQGS